MTEMWTNNAWKGWYWEKLFCGLTTRHKLSKNVPTTEGQYKTCKCGHHRWWSAKFRKLLILETGEIDLDLVAHFDKAMQEARKKVEERKKEWYAKIAKEQVTEKRAAQEFASFEDDWFLDEILGAEK